MILTLHWGLEHEFYPHPDQLAWAHRFAELGADVMIGHHPRVIQFTEICHPASGPERAVPILYSLGNLTPAHSSPPTVLSMIANLRISNGRLDGVPRTMITGLDPDPGRFHGRAGERTGLRGPGAWGTMARLRRLKPCTTSNEQRLE